MKMGIQRLVWIYRCCKVCGKGDTPISREAYDCPVCGSRVEELSDRYGFWYEDADNIKVSTGNNIKLTNAP